ncbi:hypothetical protein [Pedobacter aquatilis]|uniref:hypothetical protein n=1 Tax=Pedobacter aquatilis TaxID=351343 RepID=UPI0029308222|nr:hypothetical protein [Pedobacter aquatilis]
MIELAYTHTTKDNTKQTYTIVEYASPDQFDFMKNGDLVHRAAKKDGRWVQTDNSNIDGETIDALGKFMDEHHKSIKGY